MAPDESGSFLGDDFPITFDPQVRAPDRSKVKQFRKPTRIDEAKPKSAGRTRKRERPDLSVEGPEVGFVSPEDRRQATDIINEIGRRFSENRDKNQSAAYEQYQKDLADNASYLVKGGIMSMKELSELLMKLEEFRKRSSEQGKTQATLLAEWLRGVSETIA